MLNDDRGAPTSDDEDTRKRATGPSAVCDSLNNSLGLKTFNNCSSPNTKLIPIAASEPRNEIVARKEVVSSNEHRINGMNGINRMDRMERVRQQEQKEKEREKINR